MSTAAATIDLPKSPSGRRAWLSYQLRLRGLSISALARKHSVSREALSNAMVNNSSHLEQVIAAALETTPQALFPERFDRHGRRLAHTRAPNRSTQERAVSPENLEQV